MLAVFASLSLSRCSGDAAPCRRPAPMVLAHSHCRLAPFGVAQFEDDSFLPKMCGVKDEQGALYSFSELFFLF